jgi:hypothetical protein
MFIAVSSELAGKGVAVNQWLDTSHYLHSIGFRNFYARFSNIRSFALMKKMGGWLTGEETLRFEGKEMPLLFGKAPLMPYAISSFRLLGKKQFRSLL